MTWREGHVQWGVQTHSTQAVKKMIWELQDGNVCYHKGAEDELRTYLRPNFYCRFVVCPLGNEIDPFTTIFYLTLSLPRLFCSSSLFVSRRSSQLFNQKYAIDLSIDLSTSRLGCQERNILSLLLDVLTLFWLGRGAGV